jgi:hypothetical protein
VHKSQGSEYPSVVLALRAADRCHAGGLPRPLHGSRREIEAGAMRSASWMA